MRSALLALSLLMAPAMAQTQADMAQSRCAQVQAAHKTLDRMLQQVLSRHKGDARATKAINRSQVAWQAFRAAQLEAIYPEHDKNNYGSAYTMCNCLETRN
ncbi:MAG: DUF1311 domain-containing protein [Cyanobacteria bacterium K_DeepCast_35m_m2_023]|nr:DUF1311 domain-containing protein [Cyanobacteria bacterium K_DeepCast_35m_m2_023]